MIMIMMIIIVIKNEDLGERTAQLTKWQLLVIVQKQN